VKDPVITEYVIRVGQNLARNSDLKIPLTVKVIDDPTINAFTLPGGYVYVNTGTILAADEEDELAGVMAHEIGHAAARHWASTMTRATFLQAAMTSTMIFVPMSYPVHVGVMEGYMNGVPLAFLKFSRKQEQEADYLGLQYMYKAGYDPDAFVAFFGKVMDQERRSPGSMAKIFADHPPTGDRILAAQDEIQKILPQRPEYLVTTSEYDEMRSRLQTVMAQGKRLQKGANSQDNGPDLHKNASGQTPAQSGGQPGQSGGFSDDSPPVLKRKD